MFSCEYCEIFKSTYFKEHLQTTASIYGRYNNKVDTGIVLAFIKFIYCRKGFDEQLIWCKIENVCMPCLDFSVCLICQPDNIGLV